jgi:NADH:ubiquinone oxidoreductase subunit 6 (subunit J)
VYHEFLEVVLLVAVLGLIIVAMESRSLKNSTLLLCGAFIVLGIFYGLLGAIYVMALQLLIYGGAVTALLIALINITRGEFEE